MKPKILLSVNNNNKREYYIDAVKRCGGDPVAEYCPEYSADYDGLILCGGSDVNPSRFGQEIDGSRGIDTERDDAEFKLFRRFIADDKPIMGICRGHQVINIALGGTLYQDIPTAERHISVDGRAQAHFVTAMEKSFISDIYGEEFSVNSSHHQALDKLGKGLRIVAVSRSDGYAEAIVHEALPIFGVQWHPERMCFSQERGDTVDGRYIFEYFLKRFK